jgi:hypothetical protein
MRRSEGGRDGRQEAWKGPPTPQHKPTPDTHDSGHPNPSMAGWDARMLEWAGAPFGEKQDSAGAPFGEKQHWMEHRHEGIGQPPAPMGGRLLGGSAGLDETPPAPMSGRLRR